MHGRQIARAGQAWRRVVVALLAVTSAVAAATVSPAEAAFPGANGPIVYPCVVNPASNQDLCRLDPTPSP